MKKKIGCVLDRINYFTLIVPPINISLHFISLITRRVLMSNIKL